MSPLCNYILVASALSPKIKGACCKWRMSPNLNPLMGVLTHWMASKRFRNNDMLLRLGVGDHLF